MGRRVESTGGFFAGVGQIEVTCEASSSYQRLRRRPEISYRRTALRIPAGFALPNAPRSAAKVEAQPLATQRQGIGEGCGGFGWGGTGRGSGEGVGVGSGAGGGGAGWGGF